jgi:tRNA-binding EMAP/Myf-like protein
VKIYQVRLFCGADNVVEGQFVLVATPGTRIANGLTIANREIRGKSSEGMICALTEIGLEPAKLAESESDSIYVVHTKEETHTYLGDKNALDIIGFNDAVWDVDLTLNRSDALAALQIAKELANYFGVSKSGFKIFDEKIYGYQPTTKTTIKNGSRHQKTRAIVKHRCRSKETNYRNWQKLNRSHLCGRWYLITQLGSKTNGEFLSRFSEHDCPWIGTTSHFYWSS